MNSIIYGNRKGKCYACGRYCATECHHMMHGPDRNNAEHYGLTVYLCPSCHRKLHTDPKHRLDHKLQRLAQLAFMERWGKEEWMKVFMKNYL